MIAYDVATAVLSLLGLATLVAAFHFFIGTEEVGRWSRPAQIGLGLACVVFMVSVSIGIDGIREIKAEKECIDIAKEGFGDVRECF